MNNKIIAGIGAAALLCSLGIGQAFAATASDTSGAAVASSATMQQRGGKREMTDEQKAEMEAKAAQREEQLNAFLLTLTDEQKALYEATKPTGTVPAEGQKTEKFDETAMADMKAKEEAFIASLTDTQKAAYEELFGRKGERGEMTDEQKAAMETQRAQREEKLSAFLLTLTDAQKSAYETLTPQKPGETGETDTKAQLEAFIASLNDTQKAAYEELKGFGGGGRGM